MYLTRQGLFMNQNSSDVCDVIMRDINPLEAPNCIRIITLDDFFYMLFDFNLMFNLFLFVCLYGK